MNNNIDRITKGIAEVCKECIGTAVDDSSASYEMFRGGGSSGGIMTRLLMPRPISKIRISEDALQACLDHDVLAFDYFILPHYKLRKKHKNFFSSNEKDLQKAKAVGQFLTADHNVPNIAMLKQMIELHKKNPNASVSEYRNILNQQCYDLITIEENYKLNTNGFKNAGTKEERDALCSKKIEFVDLWLTPTDVIEKFFEITKLDKSTCLDPCASDGRWLDGQGYSYDILPMKKHVIKKDFLTMTKEELPSNVKTIVGNLPFSLLKEFVEKSLELVDDCYFLVSGDTIFNYFPENIEHIYIFSGLEGNQKDNRSRCEFDVPFLIKSALWCCIVHITKEKQPAWNIESSISNAEKRDGYHVALGKNTFIKSDVPVDENPRITKIPVKSCIKWKGGKKLIDVEYETVYDLKNINNINDSIKELKNINNNDTIKEIKK